MFSAKSISGEHMLFDDSCMFLLVLNVGNGVAGIIILDHSPLPSTRSCVFANPRNTKMIFWANADPSHPSLQEIFAPLRNYSFLAGAGDQGAAHQRIFVVHRIVSEHGLEIIAFSMRAIVIIHWIYECDQACLYYTKWWPCSKPMWAPEKCLFAVFFSSWIDDCAFLVDIRGVYGKSVSNICPCHCQGPNCNCWPLFEAGFNTLKFLNQLLIDRFPI